MGKPGILVLVRRDGRVAGEPPDRRRRGAWRSAWPIVTGLALLFGLAFLAGRPRHEPLQLHQLPESSRAALYRNALAEVRSICRLPAAAEDGVVRDHCVAQAQLLIMFPECDHDCQLAARSMLPHAHR
jgi:hypothetical protein